MIAVDIEQLAWARGFNYTRSKTIACRWIQATAAIITGGNMSAQNRTCAFATLNEFTPASGVLV